MTMRDLKHFRPDYVVQRGADEDRCPEAHRIVRNSVAIARVFRRLMTVDLVDALTAVENAETPDDGVYMVPSRDAAVLATVLEQVNDLLRASLDRDGRPQGPAATDMLDEAVLPVKLSDGSPDPDRVFEITADGSIALRYPRISLYELRQRLPEVAAFLRRAGERGEDVLVDD